MLFPLITTPYITRVLGVEQLGKYQFSASIVGYFTLMANLGINTYAIREGAKYRETKEDFDTFSRQIFTISIISTVLSFLFLIITTNTISKVNNYRLYVYILSVPILCSVIGCEWVLTIYEDFVYSTIRSIVLQLIYILFLFVFVHNENDLTKYCCITLVSTGLPYVANIKRVRNYWKPNISSKVNYRRHIPPILFIFANTLATTIYVNSDLTILGFLTSDYDVGIYGLAVKVYTVVKHLLASIIIVSVPRLSLFWGKGEIDEFRALAMKIFNVLLIILMPIVVGIYSTSDEIIDILGGYKYIESILPLKVLCLALLFSLFSWFFTDCILIPTQKEKQVLNATIIAALANVGLNFILIPTIKSVGAAITTVFAETISLAFVIIYSRKSIVLAFNKKNIVSVISGCIIIIILCKIVDAFSFPYYFSLIIKILTCPSVYLVLLIVLHNPYASVIVEKVTKRLHIG